LDDGRLVRAAIKGDDEAFYQVIYKNKEKLYRIAYSYFKNERFDHYSIFTSEF
jgi:RNA polymerase sigma-70 factor (ECF subfamily)